MGETSVYYAHPKFLYHTETEREEIEAIKRHFPEANITNPAEIEAPHGKAMEAYEETAASHDIVVYRPVARYYVTAGVYREAETAHICGKKLVRILPSGDKPVLEEVETVREYPLPPAISVLLGSIWGEVSESELERLILDIGYKHPLSDEQAVILACARVWAKKHGMSWKAALEELNGRYNLGADDLVRRSREVFITEAIDAVLRGKPILAASKEYGVPYTTLRRRIRELYPELRKRPPEPTPTPLQEQIILGCLLGDAGFVRESRGGKTYVEACIKISHAPGQHQLVDWKYEMLRDLAGKPPHYIGRKKPVYGFYIRANSFTRYVKELGPHPLTREFLKLINHPIALAVWFLDDGSYTHDGATIILSTESFSKEENEMLASWLKEKWGIEAKVVRHTVRGKPYHRIAIADAEEFLDLIRPYVSEVLPEKLPRRRTSEDEATS
jgi:hypothetical protein